MPQDALEDSLARPFGVRVRSGGAILLARRYFYTSQIDTPPMGASRARARCIGGGGAGRPASPIGGGGGGAFASGDLRCSPTQKLTVTVPSAATANADGGDVSVVGPLGSVVAAGGKSTLNGSAGGLAANSKGQVVRSGGNGGNANLGTGATAGQQGGPAGADGPFAAGGGSAGDLGDADTLLLGGRGAYTSSSPLPGYGGGGGGGDSGTAIPPLSGMVVIEYWSE